MNAFYGMSLKFQPLVGLTKQINSSFSIEYANLELRMTPNRRVYDPTSGVMIQACLNAYCSREKLQCQFWNPMVSEVIMISSSDSPHVYVNLSHFYCLRKVHVVCRISSLKLPAMTSEIRLNHPLKLEFPRKTIQPTMDDMVGKCDTSSNLPSNRPSMH